MSRSGKFATGVASALVVVVLAAGCGNKNSDNTLEPTSAGTTAPATSSATVTTPDTSPTSGNTVTTTASTASTTPPNTVAPKNLRLGLVEVAKIESPTALAVRKNDTTLFVTSQNGKVFAVRQGIEPVAVLDITETVLSGGEQGLLGLAFSIDGNSAYVDYTLHDGSGQIDAYKVTKEGLFDPATKRALLNVAHPDNANHNGGSLVVGRDGMLYIGTGDGGSAGDPDRNAQDRTSLLGKILRIDPNPQGGVPYGLPHDNPFYAFDSARNEIWAYGLRNPWRFSFDRLTGDLWIGDVGQDKIEEVDFVSASDGAGKGANFGWSAYEGTRRFNKDQAATDWVRPLHEYSHRGSASITGGFVYRGAAIPRMYGAYLFGDAVTGTISALGITASGKPQVANVGTVDAVSSFGEDNDGELYVLSYSTGTVFKIVGA